jgi:hypothetical protein
MTQERQDGWYWVKWPQYSGYEAGPIPGDWRVGVWDAANEEWIDQGLRRRASPVVIGPRIPSPDEPNALLDVVQKAQELMLAIDHDYQALSAQVVIAAKADALRSALAKLEEGS